MILPDFLFWSIYVAYIICGVFITQIYKKIGVITIPLAIIFTGFYWSMYPESEANKPKADSVISPESFDLTKEIFSKDALIPLLYIGGIILVSIFLLWGLKVLMGDKD